MLSLSWSGGIYLLEPPPGEDRFAAASRASTLMAVCGVMTSLATMAAALRVFTKLAVMRQTLSVPDLLVIAAVTCSWGDFATMVGAIQLGLGSHGWQVLMEDFSPGILIYTVLLTITHSVALAMSRLSLLVLYLSLSTERVFRMGVIALIVIVIVMLVGTDLLVVLRCKPIHATWDVFAIRTASCLDLKTVHIVPAIVNIAADIFILVLPWRIVMPLQMPTAQKRSILLLFATGIFVCVAASIRTSFIDDLMRSKDYPWDVTVNILWAAVELNTGIICAAVPALKPFFIRFMPRIFPTAPRRQEEHGYPVQTTGLYHSVRAVEFSKNGSKTACNSYELFSNHDEAEPVVGIAEAAEPAAATEHQPGHTRRSRGSGVKDAAATTPTPTPTLTLTPTPTTATATATAITPDPDGRAPRAPSLPPAAAKSRDVVDAIEDPDRMATGGGGGGGDARQVVKHCWTRAPPKSGVMTHVSVGHRHDPATIPPSPRRHGAAASRQIQVTTEMTVSFTASSFRGQ